MADDIPVSVEELKRRCAELEELLEEARGERDAARAEVGRAAAEAERRIGTSFVGDLVELARRAREEHERRSAAGDAKGGEQFAHHAQAFEYVASQIHRYLQKAGLVPSEPAAAGEGKARAEGERAAESAESDAGAERAAAATAEPVTTAATEPEPEANAEEAPAPAAKAPSRYDMIEID